MKFLIAFLIIIALFCFCCVPFIVRKHARKKTFEILHDKLPTTEKQITRCIAILTLTNGWILDGSYQDHLKIERLRDMLKEMRHPHG